jgi:carbon monoxide dehydrogenase subunit G
MAARPDPEVGYRRAGDHRRADGIVERRVFVQATPRVVWTTLHDPATLGAVFPELQFGPGVPSWPAAGTTREGRARLGLLRERALAESLEARPDAIFRMRVSGTGFLSEWTWRLEPLAGGTRVLHSGLLEPVDRWATILVRLGRATLEARVETHLRVLKDRAEAVARSSAA